MSKGAELKQPAKPKEPVDEATRLKINLVEIEGQTVEFRGQHKQDQFVYDVFFKGLKKGTYFECGALDGRYLSNTFAFERFFEWRGVLVEPLTHQYEQLVQNRPNSTCFNACVGPKEEWVLFFNHKGGGLSGIVKEVGRRHIERLEFSYMNHPAAYQRNPDLLRLEWKEVMLTSRALEQGGLEHINFFSLDVEGGEYAVLMGIDFNKTTVDVFCIEVNPGSSADVHKLLRTNGYSVVASVGQDLIYARDAYLLELKEAGVDIQARMASSDVRHKLRSSEEFA